MSSTQRSNGLTGSTTGAYRPRSETSLPFEFEKAYYTGSEVMLKEAGLT